MNPIFLLFGSSYYFENVIKLLSEHYQVFQQIPMLTEWGIIQKCLHVIIPKFCWFATLSFVLQVIFIFLELHSNYLTIIFFTSVTALSNFKKGQPALLHIYLVGCYFVSFSAQINTECRTLKTGLQLCIQSLVFSKYGSNTLESIFSYSSPAMG